MKKFLSVLIVLCFAATSLFAFDWGFDAQVGAVVEHGKGDTVVGISGNVGFKYAFINSDFVVDYLKKDMKHFTNYLSINLQVPYKNFGFYIGMGLPLTLGQNVEGGKFILGMDDVNFKNIPGLLKNNRASDLAYPLFLETGVRYKFFKQFSACLAYKVVAEESIRDASRIKEVFSDLAEYGKLKMTATYSFCK